MTTRRSQRTNVYHCHGAERVACKVLWNGIHLPRSYIFWPFANVRTHDMRHIFEEATSILTAVFICVSNMGKIEPWSCQQDINSKKKTHTRRLSRRKQSETRVFSFLARNSLVPTPPIPLQKLLFSFKGIDTCPYCRVHTCPICWPGMHFSVTLVYYDPPVQDLPLYIDCKTLPHKTVKPPFRMAHMAWVVRTELVCPEKNDDANPPVA